jgi:signal transduction histidine kinase
MAVRGKDGRLWMPTRNGLVVVRPEAETRLTTPPPVMLKRVQVDGQPLGGQGAALLGPETAVPSARLSPLFRRLVFDFAALSFVRPENDYFRYRLMGLEEEWTEVRAQQSVAYSRLAPGAYRFEVKACNSDGLWSENPAVFAFVVSPFFWQTWWFRLTVLAGVTLGVAAVVRYVFLRRLRLRLRAVEQQAALDCERGRIAKDLHDDLGASMTRMTLLLELASQRGAELGGAADHVSEGLSAAREAIKSLDAAVWAVNPRNNTLPELIDYLGQFAVEFLKSTPIRCALDLPEHPSERPVSAELRHNLFLILKEALNNVVRHSHASEMRLQIAINETELTMSIEDNGRGFERAPENKFADGLQNMRQRAETINGQFEIESRPGAGTRLRVRYRWPQD